MNLGIYYNLLINKKLKKKKNPYLFLFLFNF